MKSRILNIGIAIILFIFGIGELSAESNFSGKRVKNSLIEYVRKNCPSDCEILISRDIQDFKFEQDEVIAKFVVNSKNLRGSCVVGIEFYSNDVLLEREEIPMRVKIYENVPVANKAIARGKVIQAEDVDLIRKDASIYAENELPKLEDIINRKSVQNIGKGSIITNKCYASANSIHRGEQVTVISQIGGVRVSAKGSALNDAQVGDKIRVKREADKSGSPILEGIAQADGIVLIKQ
jgi:flagella basal body P-ring formation protein FlgA